MKFYLLRFLTNSEVTVGTKKKTGFRGKKRNISLKHLKIFKMKDGKR